ncbi:MAG TPA: PDZ domain-containing protein [Desulfuromonadales bacterium]|nr:PDZ domain-containing protein [Desulfuromonadales bacterium]
MKYIKHLANPIVMFLMMCTFAYTYFFYLGDNGPRRKQREAEKAKAAPVAPNPVVTVGTQPTVVDANPFNLRSKPGKAVPDTDNPFNLGNAQPVAGAPDADNPFNLGKDRGQVPSPGGEQFFNQQNRQRPVPMPDENQFAPQRRKKVNIPLSPAQNPFGVAAVAPIVQPDPTGKFVLEGHWAGLEVIPLTPAIAKANNIPVTVRGVLIDEVTLAAANAGIQAVDVITAINDVPVVDLRSFRLATKPVALATQANVTVFRNGTSRVIPVVAAEELGIAQLEGAPMILATARSPHAYYGPCVNCHAISKTPVNTNQMAKDMGDALTKVAPNIRRGTPAPHRDRGACSTCHVIL